MRKRAPALSMRDGTSQSPSRPRSRRNLAVSGSACTALGRPAVEPYTGSPTMALRRDGLAASPASPRLPRTTRLRFALRGAQRACSPGRRWPPSAAMVTCSRSISARWMRASRRSRLRIPRGSRPRPTATMNATRFVRSIISRCRRRICSAAFWVGLTAILIQPTDATTLRIEKRAVANCAALGLPATWSLSAYTVFNR